MNHPREHIRHALVERLTIKTSGKYPTMAEERVFASRVKPLFDQLFPAILLYASDETVEDNQYAGDGFTPLKRNLTVEIEAAVKGNEKLDDELDIFALQIETALDGFDIPGQLSDVMTLMRTDSAAVIEGSKVFGVIKLTYQVTYRTEVKQPDL